MVLDTSWGAWDKAERIRLERLENHPELRVKHFRLPPLDSLQGTGKSIMTQRFPAWLFCPRCRRIWYWLPPDELGADGKPPSCKNVECENAVLSPMRHIAVCEDGHLADVDWWRWAHSDQPEHSCERGDPMLNFEVRSEQGLSLDAHEIKCLRCNASKSLKDFVFPGALQKIGQRCRGRQPWQSWEQEVPCDKPLEAIPRSQTAVHFSVTISALDLGLDATANSQVQEMAKDFNKIILPKLKSRNLSYSDACQPKYLDRFTSKFQENFPRCDNVAAQIRRLLDEHYNVSCASRLISTDADILAEEWTALTKPSNSIDLNSPLFVSKRDWPSDNEADIELATKIKAVYLIEKLRVVRALCGFRRLKPDSGQMISPYLGKDKCDWRPAIEIYGEGIFIEFAQEALQEWEEHNGKALHNWTEQSKKHMEQAGMAMRFEKLEPVFPRFALIHTFSHILMRQLCYECGYSGASVGERIYVFEDKAGVLIYTADGDSEGSLGGLIRQGREDRLGNSMIEALERAEWCSNDPICSELAHAACHACALVPETSCSHQNSLLDRQLLIGAKDGRFVKGYFQR